MSEDTETPETEPEISLDEEIQQLQAEVDQWKDHAMRAAAEADNVRRRTEREMNDARAYAIQRFARDLFTVADNLQRALSVAPKDSTDPALQGLRTGVELIEKSLHTAFETNGVKRIEPQAGEKFDPNRHQAMMEQASPDHPPGSVTQVVQTGYELFGRVVRPAMVAVAAKGSGQGAGEAGGSNPYARGGQAADGEAVDTKA